MTFIGSRHFTFVAPSSIKKKKKYIYIYIFIYHASVKVNINNLDSLLHVFIKMCFVLFFLICRAMKTIFTGPEKWQEGIS